MSWMRVRIEAARGREFPEGSHRHGYEMVLPLKADGHLDEKALKAAPEVATVHRFWEGEGDSVGQILHQGGKWMISYSEGDADDEALHRFSEHHFKEGEYVSVRGAEGGAEHALQVVSVRPEPGLASAQG
jgi:hypothetical protein